MSAISSDSIKFLEGVRELIELGAVDALQTVAEHAADHVTAQMTDLYTAKSPRITKPGAVLSLLRMAKKDPESQIVLATPEVEDIIATWTDVQRANAADWALGKFLFDGIAPEKITREPALVKDLAHNR